jgi:hypothetical protein
VLNISKIYEFGIYSIYKYLLSFLEKTKDGFECPKEQQVDAQGLPVAHPKFAHPSDCQRFYVCLNGIEPRDLGCQVGEVYNEESQKCDAPENVRGW